MKKAGRVNLFSSKPLPSGSLYRSQSMGHIQRPSPLQVNPVPRHKADDERLSPAKVRVGSRNASGASSVASGEQTVLRPAFIKPDSGAGGHRLSIDGSLGAGGYLQQPPEPPPRQIQKTSPRPQVVSSSRELLTYVRTHHPSPSEPIKLPSVIDRGDPDAWAALKSREKGTVSYSNSRHAKIRYPGSMSVLPTAQTLYRTMAKFSYRTRTGSVEGVQKQQNQDNFVVITDFIGVRNQSLLGVFDGHGASGHEVSTFIKKMLPAHLEGHFPRHLRLISSPLSTSEETTHLRTTFISAFISLNNDLLKRVNIDSSFSGSTLVSVLLRGNLALCANAGDSRAVLGCRADGRWTAVPLSHDHKPDAPDEQARIEKCGGRVEPYMGKPYLDESGVPLGPARVWMRNEDLPGLAMSRSIGDFVAAQVGVIAEPEVICVEMKKEHKFLVLASDGVWEFISNQEVSATQCVEMIAPFWEAGNVEGACEKIVKEAVINWKRVRSR